MTERVNKLIWTSRALLQEKGREPTLGGFILGLRGEPRWMV